MWYVTYFIKYLHGPGFTPLVQEVNCHVAEKILLADDQVILVQDQGGIED